MLAVVHLMVLLAASCTMALLAASPMQGHRNGSAAGLLLDPTTAAVAYRKQKPPKTWTQHTMLVLLEAHHVVLPLVLVV